jgi:ribosomal protein L11 methyltransferase
LNSNEKLLSKPYEDLFIYYLQGCLARESIIDDAAFIGNWEEDGYSFLFFSCPSNLEVATLLEDQPHLKLLDQFQMSYDEWHGQPVVPFQIGRLHIVPPWFAKTGQTQDHARPVSAVDMNAIEILLDPGVVFGTGTHATTRHCIEAIQMLVDNESIETVVDIGTGTGLLAISAVKLGCKKALALDLNLLAVKTAAANIRTNDLKEQIVAIQGSAENFVDLPSDLVISNIHYDVMKRLLQRGCPLPTKYVILSGLLRSQAAQVERLLQQASIRIFKKWDFRGIWHSYLGRVLK